jgi:hypothetical protein
MDKETDKKLGAAFAAFAPILTFAGFLLLVAAAAFWLLRG